jgi:hypothetical protein
VAEAASRAAIGVLGVLDERPPAHLSEEARDLRRALHAKRDQLGDRPGEIELLVADCAYEQWHRLLFARFLAENNLLIHPQFGVQVTLGECDELATDFGELDAWAVASRFAAEILPGIFRLDDPCVRLRLAPEGCLALEQIIERISPDTFAAADALGWVYQYWQKERKAEVNAAERKIGGPDLAPVTQLFTENYMVRFLLENSIGAWWAGRYPDSPLLAGWEYLRFDADGKPAAGAFESWPTVVANVTLIDPCCGSGHFLVEAFDMLWRMRSEEEHLDAAAAQDAVLRDNLFGLELDPRCVQIAMFALVLRAWVVGGAWRELPSPNVACSGIPVKASLLEWEAFADDDEVLQGALGRLHALFRHADTIGSLIDPRRAAAATPSTRPQMSLEAADWERLAPRLAEAVTDEDEDPAAAVLGADVQATARAADYLSRDYTIVATNVPYLGRGAQTDLLREVCLTQWPSAEADLATAMVERFRHVASTLALVLPSNWLFTKSYQAFRRSWLTQHWHLLVRLGPGAFRSISGEVVQSILWIASAGPGADAYFEVNLSGVDPDQKYDAISRSKLTRASTSSQLRNPGSVVQTAESATGLSPLEEIAEARAGISTGDTASFVRCFWEVPCVGSEWMPLLGAPDGSTPYSGRSLVIHWQHESGRLADWADSLKHRNHAAQKWRRGKPLWGRQGIAVRLMGGLAPAWYDGEMFDHNVAVVVPKDPRDLSTLWAFAESGALEAAVRSFHTKLSIESGTLLASQLDVEHWRRVGDATPLPLPPRQEVPSQWLSSGRPEAATAPLHVAVARLLGYRWPAQDQTDDLSALADGDGIVCLPSVLGERTAADRLQELLARAFGGTWSPARAAELLAGAGSKKAEIGSWLQDEFFREHSQIFRNRPFIWHIWDGRKDGFSALVNYHRLDRATLERLTYSYLGDWSERHAAGVREEVIGAEERLIAARVLQEKLALILAGDPPHDIYVRWKSVAAQAVGWEPDVNDGVRLNIRPLVQAGILRTKFNVKWEKDRGKNPDGSERVNDLHLTNADKQSARRADCDV